MCLLTEKRFCATGTVRKNRIEGAILKTGKNSKKGYNDYAYDSKNMIPVRRWQDNSEVTMCTNYDQIEPMNTVKRWIKEKKDTKMMLLLSLVNM